MGLARGVILEETGAMCPEKRRCEDVPKYNAVS